MFDPKDDKTIGCHVFILPQGELFKKLQTTINQLSEKYGGPKFEPHITFLARIPNISEGELMEKTKKMAGMMKPFEIELGEITTEDAYFRALYCKAKPNSQLEEYHKKALELFGVEDVNTYMPHLSLYYGNIDESVKSDMIQSLSLPSDMKFLADTVYLYRTEGKAQDWVQIGAYTLGG